MLTDLIEKYADTPRAKLLWAVAAVVLLAQVVALYMLCTDQVHKAQARETAVKMQRTAINDCLQSTPNSTIGSCVRRTVPASADAASNSAMANVIPVNFAYR